MKRLALIMAIVIIGLGGYFAWQHSQDKKNSSEIPSNTAQQQSTTPSTSAQKKDDPSEGGKFLVIKEWGVRFKLPESLRGDVIYGVSKIREPAHGEDPYIVYLTSSELSNLSSACGLHDRKDDFAIGKDEGQLAVTRSSHKVNLAGRESSISDGTFWYLSESSHASCAPAGDPDEERISNLQGTFIQSLIQSDFLSSVQKY